MPTALGRVEATLRGEKLRALLVGPLIVLNALALTVAVQLYHAGPVQKAILASAAAGGYLLTTLAMTGAHRLSLTTTQAYALAFLIGACGLIFSALIPGLTAFVIGVALAQVVISSAAPLTTTLWAENIPTFRRGRWYAGVTQIEVMSGLVATGLVAWWIGAQPERFPLVLLVLAAALVLAAMVVARIPTRPAEQVAVNPLRAMRWLRHDRAFATVIASYMILGSANFAVLPLRIEYLASPTSGLGYRADVVQLIVVAVPALTRFCVLPLWGRLFDRIDFLWMRALVNLCFAGAMVLFFTPWIATQILGSAVLGLAFAGGDVAWRLWTVKLAPPERRADYTSVHVWLTGVRGVAAPFIGFLAASVSGAVVIAWSGAGLVVIATLFLIPRAIARTKTKA